MDNFLNGDNHDFQKLIYSAEQCTHELIDEQGLEWFLDALDSFGIKLKLAIFLRDQSDYINSLYIQGAKKISSCNAYLRIYRKMFR